MRNTLHGRATKKDGRETETNTEGEINAKSER